MDEPKYAFSQCLRDRILQDVIIIILLACNLAVDQYLSATNSASRVLTSEWYA